MIQVCIHRCGSDEPTAHGFAEYSFLEQEDEARFDHAGCWGLPVDSRGFEVMLYFRLGLAQYG